MGKTSATVSPGNGNVLLQQQWHALELRSKGFPFMLRTQCTMSRLHSTPEYADVTVAVALSQTSVVRKQGDNMAGIPAVTRLPTLPTACVARWLLVFG